MLDHSINNPKWTIRQIPWITIIAPIILAYIAAWLFFIRKSSLSISFFALLFIVFVVPFIEITTCTFDAYLKKAVIVRKRIWRRKSEEFHFADIDTIAVQHSNSGDDGQPTYRVVFFTKDAKLIPLTTQHDTGKRKKEKLATKIAQYLQENSGYAVHLALDGIVRIQQPAQPNDCNWLITHIFNNDRPPLTSFQMALTNPIPGFMLIIPAGLTSNAGISAGIGGKIIRKFYNAYFRTMDISPDEVTHFENTSVLKGSDVGLTKRYALVSNQPAWAKAWLSGNRAQNLVHWQNTNPLGGKTAAGEPHIFMNEKGIKVVFRDNYFHQDTINQIVKFINQLI